MFLDNRCAGLGAALWQKTSGCRCWGQGSEVIVAVMARDIEWYGSVAERAEA